MRIIGLGVDLAEVSRVAGEADVVLIVAGSRHDEVGEYITGDMGKFFFPVKIDLL